MAGIAGADAEVWTLVVDDHGNLYVGGSFSVIGDVQARGVAKWDGKRWSTLGTGVSGSVTSMALSGSNLFVIGSFTDAGGVPANHVARWDGQKWSALGDGLASLIQGKTTRSGSFWGRLVFTGHSLFVRFAIETEAGYESALAEWDGKKWSNLVSPAPFITALAVLGNDLYVGGNFETTGGIRTTNLAKWDGSKWSTVGPAGIPFSDQVSVLAVSGTSLYAASGTTLARWDQQTWQTLSDSLLPDVCSLLVVDNQIYASSFGGCDGDENTSSVERWDGTNWVSLAEGVIGGVRTLSMVAGKLFAGGSFGHLDNRINYALQNVAIWDGTNWSALGSGFGLPNETFCNGSGGFEPIHALDVSGNKITVGGGFEWIPNSGPSVGRVLQWDGASWTTLGSGVDGVIFAITSLGTDLFVGGNFSIAGGSHAAGIARWDGTNWFPLGSGLSNSNGAASVSAITVSGSDLYVGGVFTSAGGVLANGIAKWDGTHWSALGPGIEGSAVNAIAVSGRKVYVGGGHFTLADGLSVYGLAQWDGISWQRVGIGIQNGFVNALAVSGSDLWVGGSFIEAGGIVATNIAKWNGSSFSAVGQGIFRTNYYSVYPGYVSCLVPTGSGLYVGGEFTSAGGVPVNGIAKWDGTNWFSIGSGVAVPDNVSQRFGTVLAMALAGDDLFAGGYFTIAGDKPSFMIAQAYLGNVPTLSASHKGPDVLVSWPSEGTDGFSLEETGPSFSGLNWNPVHAPVIDTENTRSVTVAPTRMSQSFRLRRSWPVAKQ